MHLDASLPIEFLAEQIRLLSDMLHELIQLYEGSHISHSLCLLSLESLAGLPQHLRKLGVHLRNMADVAVLLLLKQDYAALVQLLLLRLGLRVVRSATWRLQSLTTDLPYVEGHEVLAASSLSLRYDFLCHVFILF